MLDIVRQQYDWIVQARDRMFRFLEQIPLSKLHERVPHFGHETMIATHIHAADSYRFWFGELLRQNPRAYQPATEEEVRRADIPSVRNRFLQADELVEWVINEYGGRWFEEIALEVSWQNEPLVLTPLYLISHVQTHEFHHKGQIVIMAKHLGYPLPTDESLGGL